MRRGLLIVAVLLVYPAAAMAQSPGDKVSYVTGTTARTGTLLVETPSLDLIARGGTVSTQDQVSPSVVRPVATPTPTPTATPTATATATATPSPTDTPTPSPTPTPTDTPTPQPTPSPAPSSACFPSPGACGLPDPAYSNVGVPPGTSLAPSASLTITTAGTVIDGLDVSGQINVQADDVTIENSRITATGAGCGPTNTCGNAVINVTGAYHVTVSHSELTSNGPTVEHAIRNSHGGTILVDHVYQHGTIDALCWCGNATITDSYSTIHLAIANDHLENTYTDGSSLTVTHSVMLNVEGQTANLFANVNNGSGGACANHWNVQGNLFAGGGFTFYPCGNMTSSGSASITIKDNRIARCGHGTEVQGGGGTWVCPGGPDANGWFPRGGDYGVAASTYTPAGTVHSGNVWDDDGSSADGWIG